MEQIDIKTEEIDLTLGEGYRIKLDMFEGPLDLLLELVKKSKMDIWEVKISLITEQYMEYMTQLKSIDLDKASEFIAMAALLLEIKSKALLPKIVEEVLEEDSERELRIKLEEYKLYKEASLKMKEKENVNSLYRAPDTNVGKAKILLKDMNKDGLIIALKKLFLKLEKNASLIQERQIKLDRFTVEDKIVHIREAVTLRGSASFFELFDSDYSKSEIITTFQALLELIKLQDITVEQNEIFGDIILHKAA